MRDPGVLRAGTVIVCGLLANSPVSALMHQSSAARTTDSGTAPVTWLLFTDDLHLDFNRTGELRNILRTTAAALREDGSLVGVRSSGPSMVSYAPTTDGPGLDAAVRRISGNGIRISDVLVGTSPADTRELRYRSHATLSALHTAVTSLAGVTTPHKHIVFVSNGFTITPIEDRDLLAEIAAVAQASLDYHVTITALDPRLFMPGALEPSAADPEGWQRFLDASHHTLRELAAPTGGTLVDGSQPLTEVLQELRARTQR